MLNLCKDHRAFNGLYAGWYHAFEVTIIDDWYQGCGTAAWCRAELSHFSFSLTANGYNTWIANSAALVLPDCDKDDNI